MNMSKPVSCGNDTKGDAVELKVGTEGEPAHRFGQAQRPWIPLRLVYVRMHTGKDDTI